MKKNLTLTPAEAVAEVEAGAGGARLRGRCWRGGRQRSAPEQTEGQRRTAAQGRASPESRAWWRRRRRR